MQDVPATIVVVSNRKDDVSRFRRLLGDAELAADCRACRMPEDLQAVCRSWRPELIACRPDGDGKLGKQLARLRESAETPPGVVLLTEHAQPEHYLEAGRLGASHVIDLAMPAQVDFSIRRAIEHIRLQSQHREARAKLESDHVIDDSTLHRPVSLDSLPPIAATIDRALNEEQLELLFQPILSVTNQGHESHEIFLRIRSDDGYLMPGDFLPTAERYGLMPSIDRWVIQQAIVRFKQEQARRHSRGKAPLRFFINLSLHSLVDPLVIGQIIKQISEAGLPPGSFVIEVDKDTILTRLKMSKSLNRSVKKMKLQFSMDHYDVDDNQLNYAQHVQLDFIKLNESLIRRLHRNPAGLDNIREIVRAAHEHGIEVIASQVEAASELAMLYEAGVDHVQGYLVAEPSRHLQEGVALDEVAQESQVGSQ